MRPRRRSRSALAVIAASILLGTTVAAPGPVAAAVTQPSTWNFTLADVPGAADLAGAAAGVTVAVLDTWIDQAHPEFGGRVLAGADCGGATSTCTALSGSSAANDGCEPHGTHVAGILASKDYGVAPAATILPVRVLAENGGQCVATPTAVVNGINYAVKAGARVINVSLGGDSGTAAITAQAPIVTAANAAADAGDLVVFAAGNSGNGSSAGSFGSAIVVGAVGPAGTLASYSNTGAALLAPGGDTASSGTDCGGDPHVSADCIKSTWYCTTAQPGCDPHGLAYDQGTSMAAPVVAGLGALLFAQSPNRGLADVVSTLEGTAHPASGSTYGLVDGCHALLREAAAGTICGAATASGTATGTGSTTGSPAPGAATKTPARKFVGCPRTLSVKRGTKPTIRCKITPKQGGVVVAVQYPKGKTWVTKFKIKTAKDGSLRAIGYPATAATRIRLDIGKLSTVVTVRTR